MARKGDGEKVKQNLIDEKVLTKVMKRFLGTKAADPDVTKYYRVENGLHYMATNIGSAIYLLFENKFDGSFTKGTGANFFRKPMPNDKFEDVDFIPEMRAIKDGNKTIRKPTGRIHEYPDIKGMFAKHDLSTFQKIEFPADDLDQFIAIHEAMEKAAKVGGSYNTAVMNVSKTGIGIALHDSPLAFSWKYEQEQPEEFDFYMTGYHYDFSFMTSIMKSLKDMKPDAVHMYVKDLDHPIIFSGRTTEYNFNFALNRKLVL